MLDAKFFASKELIEAEVTLGGEKHKVHFRQLTATEYRRAWKSVDDDSGMLGVIVASLCNADGSQALTIEQGLQLKPSAVKVLGEAALEANGVGDLGKA